MLRRLLERWSLPETGCPHCGATTWHVQRELYTVRGTAKRVSALAALCANCGQAAILRSGTVIAPKWASTVKPPDEVPPEANPGVFRRDDKQPRAPLAADADMRWPGR